MTHRHYPYLLGLLLLLLIGCGPAEPTIQATSTASETGAEPTTEQEEPEAEEPAVDEAYPPPTRTAPPLPEAAYPAAGTPTPTSEGAYPPPQTTTEQTGIPLILDKPIEVGQTVVEGSGPPGLRVVLINVTLMGQELGSAVVDDDGRFAIEVDPVPAGVRIGLTADLEAAGLTEADVQPGSDAISIPRVGYFFDSFVTPQ